jgi:DNA-binding GntR family transcriptional regulator
LLEGYAGQQFAQHGGADHMSRLTEAVVRFKRSAESENGSTILEAKMEFYDVLRDGCGNTFLQQALKLLHNRIHLLRATSMMQPGRLKDSVAEICCQRRSKNASAGRSKNTSAMLARRPPNWGSFR